MSATIEIMGSNTVEVVGGKISVEITGARGPQGPAGAAGGIFSPVSIAADHQANANELILADASSNSITITFPAPQAGDQIKVIKTDSSYSTVTLPDGTIMFYQNSAADMIFDGTNWRII